MSTARPLALALLVLVTGCEGPLAEPAAMTPSYFLIVRVHLDPTTPLGQVIRRIPEVWEPFEEGFGSFACDSGGPQAALYVEGEHDGFGQGFGLLALAAGRDAGVGEPCNGTGAMILEPSSFGPGARVGRLADRC